MSAARGTMHQMIARGAFIASGYVLNIAMVYALGNAVQYGLLGTIVNMTNIARVLLATGLPQATSKFIADNESDLTYPILRTSLKLQWIIGGIIVAVYVAGAPLWARLLNDDGLVPYFWASAPLIPLMGVFQVQQAYFNGTHRFVIQSWLNILYSVTRVVFALVFVLLGAAVFGVLWGFALSLVVCALASAYYVGPRTGAVNPESRRLLAFAAPLMVLAIGQAVLVNLDLLQLKAYLPESPDVGYYSAMASFSRTPYFLFTAFSMTLLPVVTAALRTHGRRHAGSYVAKSTTYLFVTALPVVAIIAAVPSELLGFAFGSEYTAGAAALVWATIAQTVLALVASYTAAVTSSGKPYHAAAAWLVCIPTQLLTGAVLIPRYGMVGAAAASLVAALVGALVSGTMTVRYFGALLDPMKVAKAAAASLAVYLLMSLPSAYPLWTLPFACFGGLAVYVTIMLFVGGIDRSEIASLLSRKRT